MPTNSAWVPPELFLRHNGADVYHVYKNNDINQGRRTYLFTCDYMENDDGDIRFFDVRELSVLDEHPELRNKVYVADRDAIQTAVRMAIEAGEIPPTREGTERD